MNYHWVVPLAAAIANLGVGTVVYRAGRSSPLRQVFSFLTLMLVFWNLHAFVLYFVRDIALAFSLSRALRSASLLMAPAIFHLALSLKERPPRNSRVVLGVDYATGVALILANNFDFLVARLEVDPRGFHSIGTPLYHVFSTFLITNVVLAIGYLIHEYLTGRSPQRRQQLRFWLLGAVIALPLGLTNLLPAYGIQFYPLGNLGTAVWAGIVGYAIVRHRLMDIDVVVTKGMAYAAVAFLLVAPAFITVLWLQRLSFGRVHSEFSAVVLLMFLAIGLLFPTLRLRAESRIERSLFREKHEYRAALRAFTRSIVRILDTNVLIDELIKALSDALRLTHIAIVVIDPAKRVFSVSHALGAPVSMPELSDNHEFIAVLNRRQQVMLRAELEATARPSERKAVIDVCRGNGWEVCIPLTVGGNLTGFIGLGEKRNLDAFHAEDLELLETLGAEASVALENARLYEELKKSQDIIRRADRLSALGTLAAGIAHEVRNPLVSIQTFFQLAPDRLHDEEFFTTFLAMTANEVTRISDLITELLTFARSPTRSLGPVSLNDTVDRVATLLEPEARKHGLQLARELSHNVSPVKADNDQIKQVMINLILNAMQATEPGGVVTVATRSVQRGSSRAGQFEVSDTGVGMSQEQLDHIFDPFFTTKDKGTGLGLAIVHQIVMEHGGSISVESKPGAGTTFFVDLPTVEQEFAPTDAIEDAPADTPSLRYARQRKVVGS